MKDAKFIRIDENGRHIYQLPGKIHHVDINIDISNGNGTVEVKTAEMIGPALDWAVAKAVGTKIDDSRGKELRIDVGAGFQSPWIPSVNWYQGGPMIDSHVTAINQIETHTWWAHSEDRLGEGATALIAACRAIVAAKLGDTVSVPRELMQ